MVLSLLRVAVGVVAVCAIALGAVPAHATARELATAQGTIDISGARPGMRAPACSELIVEARDALDDHLIAETQAIADDSGACRYAVSVPAQMAVWLRPRPLLVAGVRVVGGGTANATGPARVSRAAGGIALRFTVIAPTTYFLLPNEQKVIPLSY